MDHALALALAALAVLALLAVVAHQLLVDSPLFELGAEHWFPRAPGGVPLGAALRRLAVTGGLPALGTVAAAYLVVTAPFRTWVWAVVAVVALTDAASPLLSVYQLSCRPPDGDERTAVEAALAALEAGRAGGIVESVCVVDGARAGPVNGYAVGGPFADVVGASAFAVERLDADQLAALLAHELAHHREYHALVRSGAGLVVLTVGAAALTALFGALTPGALAGLVVIVGAERVVTAVVTRETEYRADGLAAEWVGADAVVALLEVLDDAVPIDQRTVAWYQRVLSTHPPYERRVARLRRAFDVAREGPEEGAPAG